MRDPGSHLLHALLRAFQMSPVLSLALAHDCCGLVEWDNENSGDHHRPRAPPPPGQLSGNMQSRDDSSGGHLPRHRVIASAFVKPRAAFGIGGRGRRRERDGGRGPVCSAEGFAGQWTRLDQQSVTAGDARAPGAGKGLLARRNTRSESPQVSPRVRSFSSQPASIHLQQQSHHVRPKPPCAGFDALRRAGRLGIRAPSHSIRPP